MLPRISSRSAIRRTVAVPLLCCVTPIPYVTIVAFDFAYASATCSSCAWLAARALDVVPRRGLEVGRERVEAVGVLRDEVAVEHVAALGFELQQRLHDALQRGRIAAGVAW